MISSYRINVNGKPWELLNAAAVIYFGCHIFLTNSALEDENGEIPRHTVALQVGRTVDNGLHEDFDLSNHGERASRLQLELKINSDFADIVEVRMDVRARRGLGANVPQAWSAGSVFFFVSALLGLEADAPAQKLYVDPVLPKWLPDLVLRGVSVGKERLSLLFRRDGENTTIEVLDGDPGMVERRRGRLDSI